MPDHDKDTDWLDTWRDTEPLRLYLYGITVPLLGVGLVYGWLTERQLGAWLAVAAALFIGSSVAGELARRQVTSPATVHAWLAETDRDSYARGVEDALHTTPDETAAETAQLRKVRPQAERCRYIENGRRCVLNAHSKAAPHHYG